MSDGSMRRRLCNTPFCVKKCHLRRLRIRDCETPGFHKLPPGPSPKTPHPTPLQISPWYYALLYIPTQGGERFFGILEGVFGGREGGVAIYEDPRFPVSRPGVSQSQAELTSNTEQAQAVTIDPIPLGKHVLNGCEGDTVNVRECPSSGLCTEAHSKRRSNEASKNSSSSSLSLHRFKTSQGNTPFVGHFQTYVLLGRQTWHKELRNIYHHHHHHPESKKRNSSERETLAP